MVYFNLKIIYIIKTLELKQMELVNGGTACTDLAHGISGAAVVIGFAAWWSGFGAGIALVVGAVGYAVSLSCNK